MAVLDCRGVRRGRAAFRNASRVDDASGVAVAVVAIVVADRRHVAGGRLLERRWRWCGWRHRWKRRRRERGQHWHGRRERGHRRRERGHGRREPGHRRRERGCGWGRRLDRWNRRRRWCLDRWNRRRGRAGRRRQRRRQRGHRRRGGAGRRRWHDGHRRRGGRRPGDRLRRRLVHHDLDPRAGSRDRRAHVARHRRRRHQPDVSRVGRRSSGFSTRATAGRGASPPSASAPTARSPASATSRPPA